jgi:hypothetical protein
MRGWVGSLSRKLEFGISMVVAAGALILIPDIGISI